MEWISWPDWIGPGEVSDGGEGLPALKPPAPDAQSEPPEWQGGREEGGDGTEKGTS